MAYVHLEPYLEKPPLQLNGAVRRPYNELAMQAEMYDRLATLDNRIEVLQGLYELVVDRLGEYRYSRGELQVKWLTIAILLLGTGLSLWELWNHWNEAAMRILLAEDDLLLGDDVRARLRLEGDAVEQATDSVTMENALVTDEFDLLVLDIGLPRRSGPDILCNLHHRGLFTPVLPLTAWDRAADRVVGLDSGTDDHLTEPLDLDELQARVRALTRRITGRALSQLVHDELRLNPTTHQITLSNQAVELTPHGYAPLRLPLGNNGKVFLRNQLEQSLYDWNDGVESNAIEVHVHHLRHKLDNQLVRTIRSIGYGIDQPTP